VSSAPFAGELSGALGPYQALCAHVELELELAGRGEIDGLAAMGACWERLIGELPGQPPAAAAPLLERAKLIHERTRIELMRMRELVLADITATKRAQRAADGYAGQLRPRPRVDRTA
jgi:hypothetical protein